MRWVTLGLWAAVGSVVVLLLVLVRI